LTAATPLSAVKATLAAKAQVAIMASLAPLLFTVMPVNAMQTV